MIMISDDKMMGKAINVCIGEGPKSKFNDFSKNSSQQDVKIELSSRQNNHSKS